MSDDFVTLSQRLALIKAKTAALSIRLGGDVSKSQLVRKDGPDAGDVHSPTAMGGQRSPFEKKCPNCSKVMKDAKVCKGCGWGEGMAKSAISEPVARAIREKVAKANTMAAETWHSIDEAVVRTVYVRGTRDASADTSPGAAGMARVNNFMKVLRTGRAGHPAYLSDEALLPSGHPRFTMFD